MTFPSLDELRISIAGHLAAAMDEDDLAAKLLGVKGATLDAARESNRRVLTARSSIAMERYTGVLYDAFDYATLDAPERRRANRQVVIFSGLWGLVTPTDKIADYKLKMGSTLPGLGKLSTVWRPAITEALALATARRTVWDLLPNEHSAAWAPDPGSMRRRISVSFVDEATDPSTGERTTTVVNHWNKLLKGALVRHVLATQLDHHDGLADFDHPLGYRYDPERTTTANGLTKVTLVAQR